MAKLIYSTIASLDGFVADEDGNFDWAAPTPEVHAFVNDLERAVGTYLYGRKMYETMVYWETATDDDPVAGDYAEIWRAADKIVFSSTLDTATSERTRIERTFDPDAIRAMKSAPTRDITVGGPHLAAHALQAGLVDELQVLLTPYIAGGGNASLPAGLRTKLELADERRFADGTMYLNYSVISSAD